MNTELLRWSWNPLMLSIKCGMGFVLCIVRRTKMEGLLVTNITVYSLSHTGLPKLTQSQFWERNSSLRRRYQASTDSSNRSVEQRGGEIRARPIRWTWASFNWWQGFGNSWSPCRCNYHGCTEPPWNRDIGYRHAGIETATGTKMDSGSHSRPLGKCMPYNVRCRSCILFDRGQWNCDLSDWSLSFPLLLNCGERPLLYQESRPMGTGTTVEVADLRVWPVSAYIRVRQ